MPTLNATTLVKCRHRFVCRSSLYLHEESPIVWTLWTRFCRGINVLPCSGTAKHIIHFFQFRILFVGDFSDNVLNIRASLTSESIALSSFFYNQNICTRRTKQQHCYTLKQSAFSLTKLQHLSNSFHFRLRDQIATLLFLIILFNRLIYLIKFSFLIVIK